MEKTEMENELSNSRPSLEQLEKELKRREYKKTYKNMFWGTVWTLTIVAAIAILCATLWLPVLQIYGNSMTPTFEEGDIVVTVKNFEFRQGDVLAFYYNNKILVKRMIADAGDWVDIDQDGTLYINNEALYEPYVAEKSFGDCDLELPYQVPDGRWFVVGDHRSTSVDSRNTAIGPISEEQFVGKIVFRIWPLSKFGVIK